MDMTYYGKKGTGYMCASMAVTQQISGWKVPTPPFYYKHQTAENPKLPELNWGWCSHPKPGTAVLTMWTTTEVLLLLFVHSEGAHYNKFSLKPFGYSLLKSGGCFGLSDTEMLPTETKFTLGQYCNRQSNFQKLFLFKSVSDCPTRWHS